MTLRFPWILGLAAILLAGAPAGQAALFGPDPEKAKANLIAGRAALEDGHYALARKHLEDYIDDAPDKAARAMGAIYLAECLHGEERYQAVLDLLEKRRKWAVDNEAEGGFAYWTARAQLSLGDPDAAIRTLDSFETRFPDNPWGVRAWRLLARTLAGEGRWEEAVASCAGLDARYGDRPQAAANLLDWAELLREHGDPDDAVPILRRLVERHPSSRAAELGQFRLGLLLQENEKTAEAVEILSALGARAGVDPMLRADAWLAVASLRERQDEMPAAIEALAAAAEQTVDPGRRAEILRRTGRLRIRLGETEPGLALLQEAVVAAQDTDAADDLQLFLAQILQELDLHERASEAYQQYLEAFSDPDGRIRALWGRGWSLWEQKRFPEAAALFEDAYQQTEDPGLRAQSLYKVADAYLAEGQYQRAAGAYREFLTTFPGHALAGGAVSNQVEALDRAGDMDGALVLLQEQVEQGGGTGPVGRALMRMALLHADAEQWEQVEETYTRVFEMDPEGDLGREALSRRGTARYAQGWFAEALEDFQEVAKEGGSSRWEEEAHYMRGWSLYMLGEDEQALDICREFLEAYPDSALAPRVQFWLGEYYWNHDTFPEAEVHFLACADKDPSGPLVDKALFWAGRAMIRQSEYLRAKDHINRVVREHPQTPLMAEIRLLQGDILTKLGLRAEAILAFDEVITKWPDSYLVHRARSMKGDSEFTLAAPGADGEIRYEQALTSYRAVAESAAAPPELQLRARSMMGQCLEKMGRPDEAFDAYMKTVYQYLAQWGAGDATGAGWFASAAFKAAALMEARQDWSEALRIYRRVVEAGVPAAQEARKRMQKIRLENWVFF